MTNPDLALWRAVIVQSMDDASSADRSARAVLEKNRARRWLIGRSDDFKFVCDLAGLSWKAVADVMERNALAGWPRVALSRSLNNDLDSAHNASRQQGPGRGHHAHHPG